MRKKKIAQFFFEKKNAMARLPGRCQGPAGLFRTPRGVGKHAQTWCTVSFVGVCVCVCVCVCVWPGF